MLKNLTLAAVIALTSSSAFAGNLLSPTDTTVEADEGVFEAQEVDRDLIVPIVACAILCTTLLLSGSSSTTTTPEE